MRLETFFEKFDLFADAPDAVAKLRELVLRMATSGRIAEQDPSDPPASELLQEIFAERNKLISRGVTKSRVDGSPIIAGDTIGIPDSWARCMIAEVCDLQTGATPSRQEHRYFGGDIPWLVSGDVNRREITECDGRITEAGLENSNCKLVPPGSVLIALNGQGRTRGTVAVLRIAAALNQSLVAMIPYSRDRLLPEYIFWNLRGRYYAIRDITGQDQRRGLNMKLVGQLSLPIPPLAEQKRIVAKVNELMALCDRLEVQHQERETRHAELTRASLARFGDAPTPATLNLLFHKSYSIPPADLRKSILTLAVQGKLVAQNPDDEPAEAFLARTTARDAQQSTGTKSRRTNGSIEIGEDEVPFPVPDSWVWTRLETIAVKVTDGEHLSPVKTAAGMLNNPQYVSLADGHKSRQRCDPTRGDILICSRGTIGRCAVVETNEVFCLMGSVILVRFPAECASRYFNYFLSTDLAQTEMRGMSGATAVQALYLKDIRQSLVPIPPLAEQRRIVVKVDELIALVDALEIQLATARNAGSKLLEAVVAELTQGHARA
jgi:type I restriction enzyme S subunit